MAECVSIDFGDFGSYPINLVLFPNLILSPFSISIQFDMRFFTGFDGWVYLSIYFSVLYSDVSARILLI